MPPSDGSVGAIGQHEGSMDERTLPPPPPPPPPHTTEVGGWFGGWSLPAMPKYNVDLASVQTNFATIAQEAQIKTKALAQQAIKQIDGSAVAEEIGSVAVPTEPHTNDATPIPPAPPSIDLQGLQGMMSTGSDFLTSTFTNLRTTVDNVDVDELKGKMTDTAMRTFEVIKEQYDKTKEEAEVLVKEFQEMKLNEDNERPVRSPFNEESRWASPWSEEYLKHRYEKLLTLTNLSIHDLSLVVRHRILQLSSLSSQHDILLKIDSNKNHMFDIWTVTTAAEILKIDSELDTLRYTLVPSKITEEAFWGAYFSLLNDQLDRLETDLVADGVSEAEVELATEAAGLSNLNLATPLKSAIYDITQTTENDIPVQPPVVEVDLTRVEDSKHEDANNEKEDNEESNDEIDDLLAEIDSTELGDESIDDEDIDALIGKD